MKFTKWMTLLLLLVVAGVRSVSMAAAVAVAVGGGAALFYFYLYSVNIRLVQSAPRLAANTFMVLVGYVARLAVVAFVLFYGVSLTGTSVRMAAVSFLVAHTIMLIITQGILALRFDRLADRGRSGCSGTLT